MRHFALAAGILMMFGLASCATNPFPQKLPPINGMIYDYDNIPVTTASVEVDGKKVTSSDVNGRFALSDFLPGQYTIKVQKNGYETTQITIDYTDPTQILYVKMFSVVQLLQLAEKAFERRDWQNTESLLHRAELIDGHNVPLRFLQAALNFRRGNDEQANQILKQLLIDEANDPYIHVFIADLCQYRLNDMKGALRHLEEFLDLRYDPEIEKRRDDLRNSLNRN
jgi:hypothetical protein